MARTWDDFWSDASDTWDDVTQWTGVGQAAEGISDLAGLEDAAETLGIPTWSDITEGAEYYFGAIKPGEIRADPKTRTNVYDQQLKEALAGMRGRESPADTLAKLNLGKVAGAARRGMRRGGGPLSVATGLAAMGPEQARIAAAGGRAVGAEQQRTDQLLGQAYGSIDQQNLARAMKEQARRESIESARQGLYDQSRADLMRKASIVGALAAPLAGQAYEAAAPIVSSAAETVTDWFS